MSKSRLSPVLAALAVILLMVLLISCRGEPTTAQAPTPTRSLAPSATPMSASTLTPAPAIAVTPEEFEDSITMELAQESTRVISEGTHEFVTEDLLEAHKIEPYLVGNLLFISHWDEDVQRWFVYDNAGSFTPEQLTPPPGAAIPPNSEIGILNELERGKLYDFHVRGDQIVNIIEGEIGDWPFSSGANFIEWSR